MPIRRKKDKIELICFLLVVLLLTGCRSTKKSGFSSEVGNIMQQLQQTQAMQPIDGGLSSKLKIEAALGEKTISVGGTLGIEKGVGLQIAATALGLFEVARLEATPIELCLINKVGKEYARTDYSQGSLLGQVGLKYNMLQAVFMNEPFMPNGDDFYSSLDKVTLLRDGNNIVAVTPEFKGVQYTFTFDATTGELLHTEGVYNSSVRVMCNYSHFEQLDKRTLPTKIDFEIKGTATPIKLSFRLSNIKEGRYTFRRSTLSSYKKMNVSDIIKALGK